MGFQNNDYGLLGRTIQGALKQAEQAIQSGRLSPLQSQQKNVQIYRVPSNNAAPVAGSGPRQAGTAAPVAGSGPQSEQEVYREKPAEQVPGKRAATAGSGTSAGAAQTAGSDTSASATQTAGTGNNAGAATAASVQVSGKAPDYLEKLLKNNFNEENLLSGIIMAEVLGRPKCLRRGRW